MNEKYNWEIDKNYATERLYLGNILVGAIYTVKTGVYNREGKKVSMELINPTIKYRTHFLLVNNEGLIDYDTILEAKKSIEKRLERWLCEKLEIVQESLSKYKFKTGKEI